MKPCLLLTSWFFPIKVLRWEDAITLFYLGKAEPVVNYGERVTSPTTAMDLPAVLRLVRASPQRKRIVKFSRVNVYTRDGYQCQYCGAKGKFRELTYDHVVPRCAGGRTDWNNVVTCCKPCNMRKADQTCDNAGMWPMVSPKKPPHLPLTPPAIGDDAPEEWRPFTAHVNR